MTQPFGRALLGEWLIEKNFTFLNHGSFGAVPRAVLSAQNDWRIQLERQPVRFINETLEPALRAAAARLPRPRRRHCEALAAQLAEEAEGRAREAAARACAQHTAPLSVTYPVRIPIFFRVDQVLC